MDKFKTTASGHGTINSPTTGEILYIDKDHSEERYHSPLLTRAEADAAFQRGLIEDPDDAKKASEKDVDDADRDPNALGTVAAEHTAEFAKEDDTAGQGSGTLDSRSSTAWEDRGRVEGGVDGYADGVRDRPAAYGRDISGDVALDTDSGDADAPPAPRGRAKPSK